MAVRDEETPVVLPDDPSFGTEVQIDYPGYRSTRWRAPKRPLVSLPEELHDLEGPVFGSEAVEELDHDLTRQHAGEPLGERIIVTGRVLDEEGRPLRRTLVEVWQANAAGRYQHVVDQHPAPLDANFSGAGRCLTDDDGRYRFVTVKPGAYPWGNHENAWRPAHIHFSIFGRLFTQRLVTQMYFPGDPLFPYDPIFNSVRDPKSRELLVARFDLEKTQPEWALGFQWDIVLGRGITATTPSQTVGPFYAIGLCRSPENELVERGELRLIGQLLDGAGMPVSDGVIEIWDGVDRRWGRSGTDADGRFSFVASKPRSTSGAAPHFDVFVFARGLLRHQLTRIYFPDEEGNDSDPVLSSLETGDRQTLIAEQEDGALRFDIRLQGDRQTVFFAH